MLLSACFLVLNAPHNVSHAPLSPKCLSAPNPGAEWCNLMCVGCHVIWGHANMCFYPGRGVLWLAVVLIGTLSSIRAACLGMQMWGIECCEVLRFSSPIDLHGAIQPLFFWCEGTLYVGCQQCLGEHGMCHPWNASMPPVCWVQRHSHWQHSSIINWVLIFC